MNALEVLAGVHSWQLNRISPTTFPQDVMMTIRRSGTKSPSKAEMESIVGWIRSGVCYRCRIGKGRFYFGSSPEEAARRAVKAKAKS